MWRTSTFRVALGIGVAVILVSAGILVLRPSLGPLASTPVGPPSSGGTAPPSSSNGTAGGSSPPPPGGNRTTPPSAPSDNLTLAMAASAASYPAGHSVDFRVTIRNNGTTNETIPEGGCNPWLLVQNVTGAVLYDQMSGVCPFVIAYFILAPGQSFSLNLSWSSQTTAGQDVAPGACELTETWYVGADTLTASAWIQITP